MAANAPLEGILVLDLSRVLAGPWASQTLADLGATVIKVEKPGQGDDTRAFGPPFYQFPDGDEISAYFMSANRGKQSICIDISTPEGVSLVQAMAAKADILVENYKQGDLERRQLGYETLREINPGLIYCSVTGFGQTGPYKQQPGYDFIIQGMAGLMSITGDTDARGGTPQKVGVALADVLTGLYSTIGILAALQERQVSGLGQQVDMALLDVVTASLANQASNYLVTGDVPVRLGNAHPNIVPYQSFATSDGHLIIAVGNDSQFKNFCDCIGRPDIAQQPAYATNANRVRYREELVPLLEDIIARRPLDAWLEELTAAGVPASPINTLDRVFNDPQVKARGMEIALDGLPLVASPIKLSRSEMTYEKRPPKLGEHTRQILQSVLDKTEAEIDQLENESVISSAARKT